MNPSVGQAKEQHQPCLDRDYRQIDLVGTKQPVVYHGRDRIVAMRQAHQAASLRSHGRRGSMFVHSEGTPYSSDARMPEAAAACVKSIPPPARLWKARARP